MNVFIARECIRCKVVRDHEGVDPFCRVCESEIEHYAELEGDAKHEAESPIWQYDSWGRKF